MHPRVFAALGSGLVTNDVVAVIELVKNSYDAFASNVWVRFRSDDENGAFLEIEDDGHGMTEEVIKDVWCTVATPFKENNPIAENEEKVRRVVGEKGLGRLSVARLGQRLQMLTQSPGSDCWEVAVNWSAISSSNDMADCYASYRNYPNKAPFKKSGTRLRIFGLSDVWDESRIGDLQENLARLISPFSSSGDFNILLCAPGESGPEEVRIGSYKFLSRPKYAIIGDVDESGNIECRYLFRPVEEGKPRTKSLASTWKQVYEFIKADARSPLDADTSHCGPFSFEIRGWDIDTDGTREIADRFKLQRSRIRKTIRAHKGISIYRDDVLVLPKSDNARDWLGLDLRRVSRVGTRLSTSQLVGYVSISAEHNPNIGDTSDRERLVSTPEVAEFEGLLKFVISLLEIERDEDRIKRDREKPLKDLLGALTAEDMVSEVIALAEEGAEASQAVPILRAFSTSLDEARKAIQERFVFYSRMATVGTIAQMLVHEIRTRTTAFDDFLDVAKNRFGPFKDRDLDVEFRSAGNAVHALERLADTFAPLASRAFRRRLHHAVLEEGIRESLTLKRGNIKQMGIKCQVPDSETHIAVDPGELDAVLLNLIDNSIYWLSQVSKDKRELEFRFTLINERTRVRVWIHDTGPGLLEEDIGKIFLPGITRKPGGIGMGLTVASELVADYGGRMFVKQPGTNGGASFAFDLPLRK